MGWHEDHHSPAKTHDVPWTHCVGPVYPFPPHWPQLETRLFDCDVVRSCVEIVKVVEEVGFGEVVFLSNSFTWNNKIWQINKKNKKQLIKDLLDVLTSVGEKPPKLGQPNGIFPNTSFNNLKINF